MRVTSTGSLLALLVLPAVGTSIACSSSSAPTPFTSSGGGSSSGAGGAGSGSGGNSSGATSSGGSLLPGSSSGGSGSGGTSGGQPTTACDPNPANYDIPSNNCDDDGDGTVDNTPVCDSSLPASGPTGTQFLNALGLCQNADSTHWGIVSATFTNSHAKGTAGGGNFGEQYGILSTFGNVLKPQEGNAFGVLSSGSATVMDEDDGPYFKGAKAGMQGGFLGIGDVPSGFPKQTSGCPSPAGAGVYDVIDVKVQVKVPANAKGFSFDFDFHSSEWPEYVCNTYNDSFIAYLTSKAFNSGTADNISFDSKGNPISVNAAFFQVCTPGAETGCAGNVIATSTCSLGEAQLAGTGFGEQSPEQNYCSGGGAGGGGGGGGGGHHGGEEEDAGPDTTSGGATSWLTSTAPLESGETMSLEFIIWDTGDWNWDSSVLIDNWVWQPTVTSSTPITQPSPPPTPK